jgi:hypothetical protein
MHKTVLPIIPDMMTKAAYRLANDAHPLSRLCEDLVLLNRADHDFILSSHIHQSRKIGQEITFAMLFAFLLGEQTTIVSAANSTLAGTQLTVWYISPRSVLFRTTRCSTRSTEGAELLINSIERQHYQGCFFLFARTSDSLHLDKAPYLIHDSI